MLFIVAILYLSTIVIANWLIVAFGVVPIGFGLLAPAGVFAAGLAFSLRDWLHELGGPVPVLIAIALGGAVSFFISPALALASVTAFVVSELLDLSVYMPLRKRGLLLAVAGSNVVGLVIDSVLFLWLAFGSLAFLPGQVVAKLYMTVLALLLITGRRAATATPISA